MIPLCILHKDWKTVPANRFVKIKASHSNPSDQSSILEKHAPHNINLTSQEPISVPKNL